GAQGPRRERARGDRRRSEEEPARRAGRPGATRRIEVSATRFVDRLKLTIDLAIGDAKVTVPAGNVKRLELAIESWGFTGEAEVWLVSIGADDPDPLFAAFVSKD